MITVSIQLATAVLGYIQTEVLLKYVREVKNDRDELNEEIAKGSLADHARIEALYAKISNTLNAFAQQVAVLQAARGKSAVGVPDTGKH